MDDDGKTNVGPLTILSTSVISVHDEGKPHSERVKV